MRYTGEFAVYEDIIQEMSLVYQHDKRPWMIGFSGGKDSQVVLDLVSRVIPSEDFIVVYMIDTSAQLQNMITSFKFEPEIIHVQEKDIGIHRPMKGNNFIDFIGVNMNAIKNSYLRWTKEWPLISSMVKKN